MQEYTLPQIKYIVNGNYILYANENQKKVEIPILILDKIKLIL